MTTLSCARKYVSILYTLTLRIKRYIIQFDYRITLVKEQAASVVLKENVDEGLVYETFSSGTPENFANTRYSELRRNRGL